jgi:hypothetical protein
MRMEIEVDEKRESKNNRGWKNKKKDDLVLANEQTKSTHI